MNYLDYNAHFYTIYDNTVNFQTKEGVCIEKNKQK